MNTKLGGDEFYMKPSMSDLPCGAQATPRFHPSMYYCARILCIMTLGLFGCSRSTQPLSSDDKTGSLTVRSEHFGLDDSNSLESSIGFAVRPSGKATRLPNDYWLIEDRMSRSGSLISK